MNESILSTAIRLRKELHENPELSTHEAKTKEILIKYLKTNGIQFSEYTNSNGLSGTIICGTKDKCVALRADMDALPVNEDIGHELRSNNQGVMHACGHDFHMAALFAAILDINENSDQFDGKVKYIFQPAEEEGETGGAKPLIEAGILSSPKVDAIFGMHVFPTIDFGKIGICEKEMMSAVDFFNLEIIGKSGHISMPQHCLNPIYAASDFINSIAILRTQYIDPFESCIIDVGKIYGGTAANIVPEVIKIEGNARSYDTNSRKRIRIGVESIVKALEIKFGVKCNLTYKFGYSALINNSEMSEVYRKAASKIFGNDNVMTPRASMTGEDFSEYLQYVRGAFAWVGTRKDNATSYSLHSEHFFATDDVLSIMASTYVQVAKDFLNLN